MLMLFNFKVTKQNNTSAKNTSRDLMKSSKKSLYYWRTILKGATPRAGSVQKRLQSELKMVSCQISFSSCSQLFNTSEFDKIWMNAT